MIKICGSCCQPATKESSEKGFNNAKISAIALVAISLIVLAVGATFWGLGHSPKMMLTGMNFLPALVGTFTSFVGFGVLGGALLCGGKMAYHNLQRRQFEAAV